MYYIDSMPHRAYIINTWAKLRFKTIINILPGKYTELNLHGWNEKALIHSSSDQVGTRLYAYHGAFSVCMQTARVQHGFCQSCKSEIGVVALELLAANWEISYCRCCCYQRIRKLRSRLQQRECLYNGCKLLIYWSAWWLCRLSFAHGRWS